MDSSVKLSYKDLEKIFLEATENMAQPIDNFFTINQQSNGIGLVTELEFKVLPNKKITIDVTDYESW